LTDGQPDSEVEEVSYYNRRELTKQAGIREIMLRQMYRDQGHEFPGINVYLQSAESPAQEGNRG
jgi:hypothetical protein